MMDAFGDAAADAAWGMLDVEPTTVGGAAALLGYVAERKLLDEEAWPDRERESGEPGAPWKHVDFEDDAMAHCAKALHRIAVPFARLTGGGNG